MSSAAISALLRVSSYRKWFTSSSSASVTQSRFPSSPHIQWGRQRLDVYARKSANCGLRYTLPSMTEAITKKCSQKQSGISRADYSNSTWLIHTKSRRRQVHGLRWQAIVFLRSQPVLGWRASWGDRAWIQLSLLNKLPDSPAWLTDRFASARQQSPQNRHKSLLNLYRLLLKYA